MTLFFNPKVQSSEGSSASSSRGESSGSSTENTSPATATSQSQSSETADEVRMTRAEYEKEIANAKRAAEREALSNEEVKDLRAKAKRLQDMEDASKTDAERLTLERDREKDRADKADKQRRDALIRASFFMLAPTKDIPADRFAAGMKLLDLDGVSVDDDGNVKGLDKAIDRLISDNPFLVHVEGSTETTRKPAPKYGSNGTKETLTHEQRVNQAVEELRKQGRGDIP